MRLVFVLSMCLVLSGSADAVKFSQATKRFAERMTAAAQKMATPVKRGMAVVVACATILCGADVHGVGDNRARLEDIPDGLIYSALMKGMAEDWAESLKGLEQFARGGKFNKFSLAGGKRENVNNVVAEFEFIITRPDKGYDFDSLSFGYVDVETAFAHLKTATDDFPMYFPRMRFYVSYYDFLPPSPLSSARGEGLRGGWSSGGYERHDFRTHGFDNKATEGFVVQQIHLLGISNAPSLGLWRPGFPIFRTSLGMLADFKQADLTEWARRLDSSRDFGAWFWLNNSLSWRFLSLWEGLGDLKASSPPPSIDFGIKIEQLRSVLGGNYTSSKDFTAIWEAITADLVWTIDSSDNPYSFHEVELINLVFELSWYRHRINAEIGGNTFNQNEAGKSVGVKLEMRGIRGFDN